jgi:hypothetical protein
MAPNAFKDQVNEQTKDIKLIDLFIFLLKYKWLFLSFMLFAGIATPLYLYLSVPKTPASTAIPLPKIYYFSQCSISPHTDKESSSSRIENLKIILQSRDLNYLEASENHLPMIRHKIWDEKTNTWVTERLYIWDERSGTLSAGQPSNMVVPEGTATLYIKTQNGILTVGFSSDEKEKTIKILDKYLSYISDFYRRRDMAMIKTQHNLYQKQLLNAKDTYLKARLLEKIIELNDKDLRARNDRYYGYDMMDSPSVTEVKPQGQITKGASTKRYIMMTLLLMMAAFVIALSIAGAMEYLTLIKKNDPEGFAVLLKHLGLKNRISGPVDPN